MKNRVSLLSVFMGILLFFMQHVVIANTSTTPLLANNAFQLSLEGVQNDHLLLHWNIAPGYHLYRDRFSFALANPRSGQIGQVNFPAGISKHDDILGDYQVYTHHLDLLIPFKHVDKSDLILLVTYQGCSDNNFCYPPEIKKVTVNFNDLTRLSIQDHAKQSVYSVQDKITHLLEERNYFWIFLAFMGFGVLLAFTPCVLPMIPILSGIILGQNKKDMTTFRSFLLSLSYVLGMSISYAVAGILVALLGSHLSEAFQTPWVIVIFSILFLLLALSLFGYYEIRLPHFLHHRILHLSHKQKSGSYVGVAIMGALSVLVVSPCVTAPLVGVLTFIAQTGDIVLGSSALFALGLGMGLPLLVIGTTEGKLLPKSGHWMHAIKSFFGILLIIVAINLLQRIVTGPIGLMLWAVFFIILAVYLWTGKKLNGFKKLIPLIKAIGLICFCYGAILLVGASMGNSDFFYPLKLTESTIVINSNNNINQGVHFQVVKSYVDIEKQLESARKQSLPVILDFYADWCEACREMDKNVFTNIEVKEALKNMTLLRADLTANDMTDEALKKYFNVIAPPTMIFFDQKGKELSDFRSVGGMSTEAFLKHLQNIKAIQSKSM